MNTYSTTLDEFDDAMQIVCVFNAIPPMNSQKKSVKTVLFVLPTKD